jgi:hypothetical protein
MFQLTDVDYSALIAELEEAIAWIDGFGLPVGATRYGAYLRALKLVDKRWREGATRADEIPIDPKLMETAAWEAALIGRVARGLRQHSAASLVQKLRVLVSGPILERDEKTANSGNRARDCGFELDVAAYFSTAGVVDLTRGVDVVGSFRTMPLFIECKRPSSRRKVAENLDEASAQILTELSATGLACYGIPAISVAKVDWAGGVVIHAKTREALEESLRSWFDRFDRAYLQPWFPRQKDGRLSAVLVHIPYTGYIGDSATITGTEIALVQSRLLQGTWAHRDLAGLVQALGASR